MTEGADRPAGTIRPAATKGGKWFVPEIRDEAPGLTYEQG